jgi:hypothetical protein
VEGLVGGLTRAAGVGLERLADAVLPEDAANPSNNGGGMEAPERELAEEEGL